MEGRRARAESGVRRANGNEDEGRLGLTARRAERAENGGGGGGSSTRTRSRALTGRQRRVTLL